MKSLEELKQKMMTLLETDKHFAAQISRASKEITNSMLAEDIDKELNPEQRDNYAVFFCIGASWAMLTKDKTQNITEL